MTDELEMHERRLTFCFTNTLLSREALSEHLNPHGLFRGLGRKVRTHRARSPILSPVILMILLYICFTSLETHAQKDHPQGENLNPDLGPDSFQYMTMHRVFIE